MLRTSSRLSSTIMDDISIIYLIRHGDRFDYANPSWAKQQTAAGNLVTDPPLSALGHRQARETAQTFVDNNKNKVSRILSSPYLRVIQTACPTSDLLGLPISIETGLSEAHATPGEHVLPTPEQRFAYFPQVDLEYTPLLQVQATPGYTCRRTGYPCEAFAGAYIKRMERFAKKLEDSFRGQTIVCFSHAASVGLVAALLRCSLTDLNLRPVGYINFKGPETDRGNSFPVELPTMVMSPKTALRHMHGEWVKNIFSKTTAKSITEVPRELG